MAAAPRLGGSDVKDVRPEHEKARDDDEGEGFRDDASHGDDEEKQAVVVAEVVRVATEAV